MIKKNIILERIRNNKPALGGWVMSNSVVSAEIMAQAGFHWVCVDAEHSQVTMETAANMFRAIERNGAEPFVRLSQNDEVEIKKFMDTGARGIIVPMIKSYEEVIRAISYIKYPPGGKRSFALSRCTGYGQWSAEYFERADQETFIGIMIEHIDAVADLDRIFSCKGIDAVFVGPYDLSGSMGYPGQFDNPVFKSTLDLIYRKAADHGITLGFHEIHPTSAKIKALIDKGILFIACGIDTLFILERSLELTQLIADKD
jgi:2-dehydro-3-deoxyglucarate aldolase